MFLQHRAFQDSCAVISCSLIALFLDSIVGRSCHAEMNTGQDVVRAMSLSCFQIGLMLLYRLHCLRCRSQVHCPIQVISKLL